VTRGVALVLALALVLAVAGAARAEESSEKAQARALLAQGNALFEKGDLKGALVVFRAAYALYPSPKLLVNAAAAERELGDLPAAANDLRHFLDESDDDPFLVDKARTDLRALERRVGRVTLSSGWPKHTAVEVDGRAARDPIVYVRPGGHVFRVRAPGEEVVEREIDAAAGENVDFPRLFAPGAAPVTGGPATGKKTRWWIPVVVVASVVVVGGAIGLGVGLTQSSTGAPLRSDLGTFKFSDFH
jgi:hypothetical protein